jgi:hypothetical protein
LGLRGTGYQGSGEDYITRNLMICTDHQIIIQLIKTGRIRWVGHVARMGEGRGTYRVLVGRPEGKRQLGRPRHRWEDNIKTDL